MRYFIYIYYGKDLIEKDTPCTMYIHFSVAAVSRSCLRRSYSTVIKTTRSVSHLQRNKRRSDCLWRCGCRKKSDCTCLPPSCNTPPCCIQYMTGYYYYPYGTWFCGPYHVAGSCPVGAKGPCPCPKCCVGCVCPALDSEKTKADMPIEKCTLKADTFPAVLHCQTMSKSQEKEERKSDKNETDCEFEQKSMPPVLASIIQPNSDRKKVAIGARIQSSYTVSQSKPDSNS